MGGTDAQLWERRWILGGKLGPAQAHAVVWENAAAGPVRPHELRVARCTRDHLLRC